MYITGDSPDVYEDGFFKVARSADGKFTPTLILVGIRLGIDRVTPVYWEALKSTLQMSQSVGIAGSVFRLPKGLHSLLTHPAAAGHLRRTISSVSKVIISFTSIRTSRAPVSLSIRIPPLTATRRCPRVTRSAFDDCMSETWILRCS